jgi:four helix bundle protein
MKKSMTLAKHTYILLKKLPDSKKFALTNQLQRCAASISSNIAEGCSRETPKDFKRFIRISIGSLFELHSQLHLANELNYISKENLTTIQKEIILLRKMTLAFIKKSNPHYPLPQTHNPKTQNPIKITQIILIQHKRQPHSKPHYTPST